MNRSFKTILSLLYLVSLAGCGSPPVEEEPPPPPVVPNADAPSVVMGGDAVESACVLSKDGNVRCWGSNSSNQLGKMQADFDKHPNPEAVATITPSAAIDFGVFHGCAVQKDGTVSCWGGDYVAGMMGDGTGNLKIPPTTIPGLTSVKSIALGSYFGCALHQDGTVSCWGDNRNGQLGLGVIDDMPHDGAAKVPGLSGVVSIAAGATHVCAVLSDNTVSCWGAGTQGQLGDGASMDHASPTAIAGLLDIEEITTGDAFSCARTKTGGVSCWGTNGIGQVGDGTGLNEPKPVSVPLVEESISLAAGRNHACIATKTGNVYCWGAGDAGQLGRSSVGKCDGGDVTYGCYVTPVKTVLSRTFRVMAGGDTTCCATESGGILCFGRLGEANGACKGIDCSTAYALQL